MSYRNETLKAVEHFLQRPLPPSLRTDAPATTGKDLVDRLRADPPPPERDAVLRSWIRAAQADPRDWSPVLLLLAANQRNLETLYRKRLRMRVDRGCGDDVWTDEAWATVLAAFQRAVARYPLRRPGAVPSNLEGLTLHELKKLAVAETKLAKAQATFEAIAVPLVYQQPTSDDGTTTCLYEFARERRETSREAPASPDEIADATKRLDDFLSVEVIDPLERKLLLAQVVEGRSLAELARAEKMTVNAVTLRIHRAKRRMRAYCAGTPARRRKTRRRIH